MIVHTSTTRTITFRNKWEATDVAPAAVSVLAPMVNAWNRGPDALVVGPEEGDVIRRTHAIIVEAFDFLVYRKTSDS